MPPITALLHTMNDALRLGRTLEMILPCAEILIVDHRSARRNVAFYRAVSGGCPTLISLARTCPVGQ